MRTRTTTAAAAALIGELAAVPNLASADTREPAALAGGGRASAAAGSGVFAQRDGTPGNPPGTAAGRAVDRGLGTNTTGANQGGTGSSR